MLNVVDGALQLGRWQRVFFVELDGPRERRGLDPPARGRLRNEGQADSSGAHRGDEPVLPPDQVLALSTAGARHAGRLSGRGRRCRDPGRARRRRCVWTTSRMWSSSRSTLRRRTAPTRSRITIAARARYVALGGLHVTSLPDEAARARRHDLPWSGRGHMAALPEGLQRGAPGARVSIGRSERWRGCRRSGAT